MHSYFPKSWYSYFPKSWYCYFPVTKNEAQISILSNLEEYNVLKENTSVLYNQDNHKLPEDYNGLGYMNLFAMIFKLQIIIEEFSKKHKREENQADINLLFIEEPEAHTHPQMQYVFIKQIRDFLTIEKKKNYLKHLQTVISTHSAHIVSQSIFNDIKYFYKLSSNEVIVKNLSDLENEHKTTEGDKKNFRFLKQYLTLNKSELFFTDKMIIVEGDTESILLPAMMKKIDEENKHKKNYIPLLSQNISIVQVGAHSQVLEKFIDFIGIKTLIITDLDAVKYVTRLDRNNQPVQNKDGEIIEDEKTCKVADSKAIHTKNSSIKFFTGIKELKKIVKLPQKSKVLKRIIECYKIDNEKLKELKIEISDASIISKLPDKTNIYKSESELISELENVLGTDDCNKYKLTLIHYYTKHKWIEDKSGSLNIAFQTNEKGFNNNKYHARSFEDAFIHKNKEFILRNIDKFISLKNAKNFKDDSYDAFDLANNCVDKKTGFATDILICSDDKYSNWELPQYIKNGMLWLTK